MITVNRDGTLKITLEGRINHVRSFDERSLQVELDGQPNVLVVFTQKYIDRWKPSVGRMLSVSGLAISRMDGRVVTYANRRTRVWMPGDSESVGIFTLDSVKPLPGVNRLEGKNIIGADAP